MTLQQALGRCMPAILSGDKTKIIESLAVSAYEYLTYVNAPQPYPLDIDVIKNKILDLPTARQVILFAALEALSK